MKIQIFNENEIRFVQKETEWWAVAKDVAAALGIINTSQAIESLDDDEKGISTIYTVRGNQDLLVISETGVYELIFKSRKEEAKAFKRWVKSVIKELRKKSGLESFEVFKMFDKEHQKSAMDRIKKNFPDASKLEYMKANSIADKAVSNKHGYSKMMKKSAMSPQMLVDREPILDETVELMCMREKYDLDFSVKEKIYESVAK
ncbi:MAG: Bro-N domain-containing protein [Enterococcus sp.]